MIGDIKMKLSLFTICTYALAYLSLMAPRDVARLLFLLGIYKIEDASVG